MNKSQRRFWAFWGGISGLVIGGYMIFYLKDLRGFIPAIVGASLLTIKHNGN